MRHGETTNTIRALSLLFFFETMSRSVLCPRQNKKYRTSWGASKESAYAARAENLALGCSRKPARTPFPDWGSEFRKAGMVKTRHVDL